MCSLRDYSKHTGAFQKELRSGSKLILTLAIHSPQDLPQVRRVQTRLIGSCFPFRIAINEAEKLDPVLAKVPSQSGYLTLNPFGIIPIQFPHAEHDDKPDHDTADNHRRFKEPERARFIVGRRCDATRARDKSYTRPKVQWRSVTCCVSCAFELT